MRRMIGAVFAAGLACCVANAPAPASAQPLKKITFLTNFVFNGRYAPFFVALEQGLYRKAGFDVQILPAAGGGMVITTVGVGKADYGLAESSSIVQGLAKGVRVKAFMVYMDGTTSGLSSLVPYESPAAIAGKRIVAAENDSARATLPVILALNKIAPDSVKWVTADPGIYLSLLLSKQVDLQSSSSDGSLPALRKVAAESGQTIYFKSFSDWGYAAFGYLLVGAEKNLAENPLDARRFADATSEAVQFAIANPEEAVRIMVKANPNLAYDVTLAQWQQSRAAMQTAYVAKNGYGVATIDRIGATIAQVKQALDIDAGITPDDFFSQLPQAK